MNILKILIETLLFALATSCNNGSEEPFRVIDRIEHKVELPEVTDSASILYSDLFSDVRYIELNSSSNNSIVSYISKLEITNNNDLIVFDLNNGTIIRYDSTGNFLNQIGSRGHGHGEFLSPVYVAYDKYRNQVLVTDIYLKKLLFYNLEGKLEKAISLQRSFSAVEVIDSTYLIGYLNYNQTDYNYSIINREGKEVTRFEENFLPKEVQPAVTYQFAIRHLDDGDLLCRSGFSSIIYRIHGKEIVPYIELAPKENDWRMERPENVEKVLQKGTMASRLCESIVINGKLICSGYIPKYDYNFLLYKNLNGEIRYGTNIVNDIKGYKTYDLYLQHKGKNIYYVIYPDVCQELLNMWNERKDIPLKEREVINKMANSVNPIIQVCTVKD